jgi:hypothetical protein
LIVPVALRAPYLPSLPASLAWAFSSIGSLDEVPDGYRAMNEREAP